MFTFCCRLILNVPHLFVLNNSQESGEGACGRKNVRQFICRLALVFHFAFRVQNNNSLSTYVQIYQFLFL